MAHLVVSKEGKIYAGDDRNGNIEGSPSQTVERLHVDEGIGNNGQTTSNARLRVSEDGGTESWESGHQSLPRYLFPGEKPYPTFDPTLRAPGGNKTARGQELRINVGVQLGHGISTEIPPWMAPSLVHVCLSPHVRYGGDVGGGDTPDFPRSRPHNTHQRSPRYA